jgi:hypothetical protein
VAANEDVVAASELERLIGKQAVDLEIQRAARTRTIPTGFPSWVGRLHLYDTLTEPEEAGVRAPSSGRGIIGGRREEVPGGRRNRAPG